MRSDDRCGGNAHQIPEGLVIEVGNVQHHAQFFHPFYGTFAGFGQAAGRVLRTAGSQSVQFVPGQHGMTCADLVVEVVDHVDVLTDLAQAFDTGDNVDLACLGAFFKIIKLSDKVEQVSRINHLGFDAFDDLFGASRWVLVVRRVDPDDKDTAGYLACLEFFQMIFTENIGFVVVYSFAGDVGPDVAVSIKKHENNLLLFWKETTG